MGLVSIVIVCLTVVAGALPKFPPPPPPGFFLNYPHPHPQSLERNTTLISHAQHAHLTFLQEDTHSTTPWIRPPPPPFVLSVLKNFPHPPHGRPMRLFFTLRLAGNMLFLPNLPNVERLFHMQADLPDQHLAFDATVLTHAVPVSATHIASPSQSSLQVFTL